MNPLARFISSSLPVRHKITLITVFVSVFSFVVLSFSFFQYDRGVLRGEMQRDLQILATIVGNNATAALQFRSYGDAEEILGSLASQPEVMSAYLFDNDGYMLANYVRPDESLDVPISMPDSDVAEFIGDRLNVVHYIKLNGQTVGALNIQSDNSKLEARRNQYLLAGAILLAICLALSALLSMSLHNIVTDPIRRLVELARDVVVQKSYSLRAVKTSDNEMGVLVDGFNDMLAEIESQHAELRRSRDELEARVAERTAELSAEVLTRTQAAENLNVLTRRLEEKNAQLERKNRELDEFTAIASHDLQEPGRKVRIFSQYLVEDCEGKLPEAARHNLDVITSAAARMQSLIQDLLTLSRTGREALKPSSFELKKAVTSATSVLSELIRERHVQITYQDLPVVRGDPALLGHVYQNLIQNAIKFDRSDRPAVEITFDDTGDRRVFGVRDQGLGISPEHHDRIFSPFKRLHQRDEFGGTGIGLAICKKIVELHGGRIWVESDGTSGSHFRFTLWEGDSVQRLSA